MGRQPRQRWRGARNRRFSYGTVIKQADVRVLAVSRAALKLGLATHSYGVMVHLARLDASQLQISIVGATSYVAALLFGAQGGLLSDTTAKRSAIAAGCLAQGVLCFLIPVYVRDVLDADPANSVYIFSLASIGSLAGPVGGPWFIARWGSGGRW
jgi:hypothetical protein